MIPKEYVLNILNPTSIFKLYTEILKSNVYILISVVYIVSQKDNYFCESKTLSNSLRSSFGSIL